jgi:hypothetical protein
VKRDFSTVLLHIDGTPLKEDGNPTGKDLTLAIACVNALMATLPGDEALTGTQKLERWRLAEAVYLRHNSDIKIEDIALMKERLARCYGPLVVGPAFILLEE